MGLREDCQEKLEDAIYYLEEMKRFKEDERAFRRSLGAFLSAVRSPLQYMLAASETFDKRTGKKTVTDKELRKWFDDFVNTHKILGLFRDLRNQEIHEKPVRPDVTFNMNLAIKDGPSRTITTTSIIHTNGEEEIISRIADPPFENVQDEDDDIDVEIFTSYHFAEWKGYSDDDAIARSEQCVKVVEEFIRDGIATKHIP